VCLGFAVLAAHAEPRHKSDRLLVKVKAGRSTADRERLFAEAGGIESDVIPRIGYRVVKVRPDKLDATLAKLQADPDVESVEKDYLGEQSDLPNDPYFLNGSQWHLDVVQAPEAWTFTEGSSEVVIAVIDSGIDPAAADLAGQTVTGYNCFDDSSDVTDTINGHGTMTAGILAAAMDNGLGVASVAPGCRVLPIKAIDSTGYISWADAAKGIIYAADHGAKIINMSFCGPAGSTALKNAIDYAYSRGVVLVAAAGNHSSSLPEYPAAYPKVVGVGATRSDDSLCSFSNYGSAVRLVAPGQSVWTTVLRGSYGPCWGTSMSSPIVAGVLGLMLSANGALGNDDAVNLLQNNADDLGVAGLDDFFGHGRVNAFRAVAAAATLAADAGPAPQVLSPTPDGSVSGMVEVQIAVPDTATVTKVECYLDGVLESSTTTVPAQFLWDTTRHANGPHLLYSKAYGTDGRIGISAGVPVMVENPSPALTVDLQRVLPRNGKVPSNTRFKMTVSLSDPTGISAVQFYVDGQLIRTDTKAAYKFTWNARLATPGDHTIEAVALDLQGNPVASSSVIVTK
jgi:subtilisin family serine protease